MLKIKNYLKNSIRILSFLLLILALAASLPFSTAFAETVVSSAETQDVGKAYYASDYQYLNDEDSVYESLTYEEAVYLFEQEGNYLVLLGGSWCTNTTAVIDYVNAAAKAAGVRTIYNLDLRLDGSSADSHIRETNGTDRDGAVYNYLYGELVTRYLTNLNDWVEYTSTSAGALTYTNAQGLDVTVPKVQVPFLFLYNKDNTQNNKGESVSGETYPIVRGFEKMIYRNGDILFDGDPSKEDTITGETYTELLNDAIFDYIGTGEGQYALSSFTDADYIRLSYNEKSGKTIFGTGDPINLRVLTYKQLDWLLQQKGDYLVLFGGSWCENTQAAIKIINDFALANDVIVYTFDTKLDGGYAQYKWGYAKDLHIRDNDNEFAELYVDLVRNYLTNIETEYTLESGNYIEVDGVIVNKLQVPYFFAYNGSFEDNDGHYLPILGYVEKMYVLDENDGDYIYEKNNYLTYTQAAFSVIDAYAAKTGIVAKDVVENRASSSENNGSEASTEDNKEEADRTYIGKIIAAVIGSVTVVGVVVYVVVKKKEDNDSSGGYCGSCGGCGGDVNPYPSVSETEMKETVEKTEENGKVKKHVVFKTQGVCARSLEFDLIDGYVYNVKFEGGCRGNTTGVGVLAEGAKAEELVEKLKGIKCRGDNSCPHQLALAIEQNL